MIRLYTDGACGTRAHQRGGWAFVAVSGKDVLAEESGTSPSTTNNRMELMAVIKALEWFQPRHFHARPEVVSDSKYVVRGITEWMPKWKAKDWTLRTGGPVKSRDHWERLDVLVADVVPTFRWVKGHNGDRFNTQADRLAKRAAHCGEVLVDGTYSLVRA